MTISFYNLKFGMGNIIEIDEINSADFDEKKDSIKFSLLIQRQNMLWSNWLQALRDES